MLDLAKTAAKKDILERQQRDHELWNSWQKGGKKPDDLRPLLNNFRGLIRSRSNRWAGNVEIPPAAVHAEFNKQFMNALDTYNPKKGAALGSWVGTNLQKAQRWITQNQNTARIGETRVYKVGQFEAAKTRLDEELGREPNFHEIADHMGWSEKEVGRLDKELRRTHLSSMWESDPSQLEPSREKEVLNLLRFELKPQELLVYEYTIGSGGKQQLKPGQIAKKTGFSPSKVTRLRQAIDLKAKKFI
jgi:DNA-directed RNA polymerase specialized sigma subunit